MIVNDKANKQGYLVTVLAFCCIVLLFANVSGCRLFMLDTNRARIVPSCSKVHEGVLCKIEYMHVQPPGPRVSFRAVDRSRLLVVATKISEGDDGILARTIFITREELERSGLDYESLEIYYYPANSKRMRQVKVLSDHVLLGK